MMYVHTACITAFLRMQIASAPQNLAQRSVSLSLSLSLSLPLEISFSFWADGRKRAKKHCPKPHTSNTLNVCAKRKRLSQGINVCQPFAQTLVLNELRSQFGKDTPSNTISNTIQQPTPQIPCHGIDEIFFFVFEMDLRCMCVHTLCHCLQRRSTHIEQYLANCKELTVGVLRATVGTKPV